MIKLNWKHISMRYVESFVILGGDALRAVDAHGGLEEKSTHQPVGTEQWEAVVLASVLQQLQCTTVKQRNYLWQPGSVVLRMCTKMERIAETKPTAVLLNKSGLHCCYCNSYFNCSQQYKNLMQNVWIISKSKVIIHFTHFNDIPFSISSPVKTHKRF